MQKQLPRGLERGESIKLTACFIPPLPGPLPEGEGMAVSILCTITRYRSITNILMTLPPPQGEGWGEGI